MSGVLILCFFFVACLLWLSEDLFTSLHSCCHCHHCRCPGSGRGNVTLVVATYFSVCTVVFVLAAECMCVRE